MPIGWARAFNANFYILSMFTLVSLALCTAVFLSLGVNMLLFTLSFLNLKGIFSYHIIPQYPMYTPTCFLVLALSIQHVRNRGAHGTDFNCCSRNPNNKICNHHLMSLKELLYKQTNTTNFRRVWNDGARQPVNNKYCLSYTVTTRI